MKTYILQKDLPDLKSGAEFIHYLYNGIAHIYSCGRYEYTEDFIMSKKDWFKLKEEKQKVTHFIENEDSYLYNTDSFAIILNKKFSKDVLIGIFKESLRIMDYCDNGITINQGINCINHYITSLNK